MKENLKTKKQLSLEKRVDSFCDEVTSQVIQTFPEDIHEENLKTFRECLKEGVLFRFIRHAKKQELSNSDFTITTKDPAFATLLRQISVFSGIGDGKSPDAYFKESSTLTFDSQDYSEAFYLFSNQLREEKKDYDEFLSHCSFLSTDIKDSLMIIHSILMYRSLESLENDPDLKKRYQSHVDLCYDVLNRFSLPLPDSFLQEQISSHHYHTFTKNAILDASLLELVEEGTLTNSVEAQPFLEKANRSMKSTFVKGNSFFVPYQEKVQEQLDMISRKKVSVPAKKRKKSSR